MRQAGTTPHGLRMRGLIVVLWRAGLHIVLTGRPAAAPGRRPAAREQLRHTAARAGIQRRFAPHQLRHAHAVEMAREGAR